MTAIVISGQNKVDLKIIIELAKRLGVNVKTLSDEEILDLGLLKAMEEGKNTEFVSRDKIIGQAFIIYWSWDPSYSNIIDLINSIRFTRIANIIR